MSNLIVLYIDARLGVCESSSEKISVGEMAMSKIAAGMNCENDEKNVINNYI